MAVAEIILTGKYSSHARVATGESFINLRDVRLPMFRSQQRSEELAARRQVSDETTLPGHEAVMLSPRHSACD